MLPLGTSYIEAKNRLSDANAWIMLLQLTFGAEVMRLCANNQDIVWNGETWVAFPFNIDVIKDATRDEVPQVVVRVSNVNQAVQYYVEQYGGGIGSEVILRVIYTGDLTETSRIPTFAFKVKGCKSDAIWATFELGVASPYLSQDPRDKILKNFCRYRFPGSIDSRCPYTGTEYTSCNKTLSDCKVRNGVDAKYYGGFPSVGSYAIYL
ncbi:MAG: hypothetical protein WA151_02250 [Desulfatirhabdiaceae bacterium]